MENKLQLLSNNLTFLLNYSNSINYQKLIQDKYIVDDEHYFDLSICSIVYNHTDNIVNINNDVVNNYICDIKNTIRKINQNNNKNGTINYNNTNNNNTNNNINNNNNNNSNQINNKQTISFSGSQPTKPSYFVSAFDNGNFVESGDDKNQRLFDSIIFTFSREYEDVLNNKFKIINKHSTLNYDGVILDGIFIHDLIIDIYTNPLIHTYDNYIVKLDIYIILYIILND